MRWCTYTKCSETPPAAGRAVVPATRRHLSGKQLPNIPLTRMSGKYATDTHTLSLSSSLKLSLSQVVSSIAHTCCGGNGSSPKALFVRNSIAIRTMPQIHIAITHAYQHVSPGAATSVSALTHASSTSSTNGNTSTNRCDTAITTRTLVTATTAVAAKREMQKNEEGHGLRAGFGLWLSAS
jgi:hypothetical protein